MKWVLTLLLAAISIAPWGDNPEPWVRIAYYLEGSTPAKTTFCVDNYGRVHIYEGALKKTPRIPVEKVIYSICGETTDSEEELRKTFEGMNIVVIHPALRSW